MRVTDRTQTLSLFTSLPQFFGLLFPFRSQCSACRTVKRNTVSRGQICLEGICSRCLYTKMLNKISLYLHSMTGLVFFLFLESEEMIPTRPTLTTQHDKGFNEVLDSHECGHSTWWSVSLSLSIHPETEFHLHPLSSNWKTMKTNRRPSVKLL